MKKDKKKTLKGKRLNEVKGVREEGGWSTEEEERERRSLLQAVSAIIRQLGAYTKWQSKSRGKRREGVEKVGNTKKKRQRNKQWAGRKRARTRMVEKQEQILRAEEEWEETEWEGGREVLLEQLITFEPTHALLSFPRANWHLQCENSNLCTHSHRDTVHKQTCTGYKKESKHLTDINTFK